MKYNYFYSVLLFMAACAGNKEEPQADANNAIAVEVQTLAAQTVSGEISLSGNIEGKTTVKLAFMVPGKVEYISSKEGEPVTKGQLLSRLELTNYTIGKELSEVQVNLAKDEFDRLSIMHKNGSVSESDYTKAGLALKQAQLQYRLQAKNVADAHLYAPLSGVLLSKATETGEVIAAGMPLFVVADIQKIVVTAFIPEGELHEVAIGTPADVYIGALDKTFTGKVTSVGGMADAVSRAFAVKVEVENKDLLIRPGMIAEVRMKGNSKETDILVPAESIIQDLDRHSYIYVIDKAQQKAFKHKVSLGRMVDNKIQILSGLSAGEVIVVAGQSKLSDGASVTIIK
ncbi:efflux RND transporter periplasmic adaptor subunit [Ohtaekwangia sp.]|uniref:efflux RND transporter periplasmic adaptor subunit n=1 Tax=Ohtaekwangia sp. TaxID=2066019 RepID=UPI002FDD16EE